MKISVTLTDAEVKGIKAYLKEVDGNLKPSKADIQAFVASYVDNINAPQEAVGDYIRQFKKA